MKNSKSHSLIPRAQFKNKGHIKEQQKMQSSFGKYLLQDYTFLQDYEMLDCQFNSQTQFLAKIKESDQFVKFKKIQFKKDKQTHQRFESLVLLFNKGVILADNIFLLQENQKYFYYVIQASLSDSSQRFMTLQNYIIKNSRLLTFQNKKSIFYKLKVLFDCVYQHGQAYCGLNTKKIIIDNQTDPNLYLMPFEIQLTISSNIYDRSYYPPQIVCLLQKQQKQDSLDLKQKPCSHDSYNWDVWSLGCVALQIFLYSTPFFMSTSISQQLLKMKNSPQQVIPKIQTFIWHQQNYQNKEQSNGQVSNISAINECSLSLILHENKNSQLDMSKLKIFLTNSLKFLIQDRQILFQQRQQEIDHLSFIKKIPQKKITTVKQQNQNNSNKKFKKQKDQFSKSNQTKHDCWKELNIFNNKNYSKDTGNYQLSIKILTISNVTFKSQIKISLHLRKYLIYNFHIDANQHDRMYVLNRKLTLTKKQFSYLHQLLSQPIYLQICQQNQKSKIQVNLQTLVMLDQGKRIWKNSLIGTYQAKSGAFQRCKVKLNCKIMQLDDQDQNIIICTQKIKSDTISSLILNTQSIKNASQKCLVERTDEHLNRGQTLAKQNKQIKLCSQVLRLAESQNTNKSKSLSSNTISRINNQLSELSNYWKQKNTKQAKLMQRVQKTLYL